MTKNQLIITLIYLLTLAKAVNVKTNNQLRKTKANQQLVKQTVNTDDCEWQCYLDRYPDLKTNFQDNLNSGGEDAKNHYINNGFAEERDCTCNFKNKITKPYCDTKKPTFAERNMYNFVKNPNYQNPWRDQGWVHEVAEGEQFSCHGQAIFGKESERCQGKSILVDGDQLTCGSKLFNNQEPCAGVKKLCYCNTESRFVKKDPYCEKLDYTFCANEQEKCNCKGFMRFGSPDNWIILDKRQHDSVTCNAITFGDPAYDVLKTCECASWKTRASEIVEIRGFWNNILVCSPTAASNCNYVVTEGTTTTRGQEISTSLSEEFSVSVGVTVGYEGIATFEATTEIGYSLALEIGQSISNELSKENGIQVTAECPPGTHMYSWNYLLLGSDGTEMVQNSINFQCNPPSVGPQCHPKLCKDDLCTKCKNDVE